MTNKQIAARLKLLTQLMELHGENEYKTKAYSNAAFSINQLPKQLSEEKRPAGLPGFGSSVGAKVEELLETGTIGLLEEYLSKTPKGIIELLRVRGLGPKKVAVLWRQLGIESLDALATACRQNRLSAVKGFGKKTIEGIETSVEFILRYRSHRLFRELEVLAMRLSDELKGRFPNNRHHITGAVRRQDPIGNAVELVTDGNLQSLLGYFAETGKTPTTSERGRLVFEEDGQPTIIVHTASLQTFFQTLFRTTNTPEYQAAFESRYVVSDHVESEECIFRENGLAYAPPALRETKEQVAQLRHRSTDQPDALLQTEEVKGLIHAHSHDSDGLFSLRQMAVAAQEKGFEYLVISDHSQSAGYANGMPADRIRRQHKEIELLNAELAPFRIFKGIEADILTDGSLDYDPDILSTFDLVIASVHSHFSADEEAATARLLKAIENPFTRILGHPTGRLLLARPGYPIDTKLVIDACAERGVVIEINANPRRLDLDWSWIPYAMEKEVLLSVNPDAHSIEEMDFIRYGVLAAQKGGLTKEYNLSSFSLEQFERFLKRTLPSTMR